MVIDQIYSPWYSFSDMVQYEEEKIYFLELEN